jgi:pilus assembly protein Flp/PilA
MTSLTKVLAYVRKDEQTAFLLDYAACLFASLRRDDKGAALIEYSILIGLIAAAVITIIVAVGTWITGRWTTLCNALSLGTVACGAGG